MVIPWRVKSKLYASLLVGTLLCAVTGCEVRPQVDSVEHKSESALSPQEQKLSALVDRKLAYKPGSYAKGQIPKGEYAFISPKGGYYSEELNGQILDNENFDSFGYVYNHGLGDITTGGFLVTRDGLAEMGFAGAKSAYEALSSQPNYAFSGQYKVGADIEPGSYLIQSVGEAYFEINAGPVGNGEIVRNDNFNGSKTARVTAGQYLKLHKATIEPRRPENR